MELTRSVYWLIAAITALNGCCGTPNQTEASSRKLLEKNAIARFANKGKDFKVVAGLIEGEAKPEPGDHIIVFDVIVEVGEVPSVGSQVSL